MEAIYSLNRNIMLILIAHHRRIAGLGTYPELEAGNATFQELPHQRDPITSLPLSPNSISP
jgi:hypothetical protein